MRRTHSSSACSAAEAGVEEDKNGRREGEAAVKEQILESGWTLQAGSWEEAVPGTVPGSIYTDMLRAGRLRDPYWRENHREILDIKDKDFTYCCRFQPDPALFRCPRRILRFEGIDARAEISLNGSPLGRVENMHRTYEFDVTHLLLAGENLLIVSLRLPDLPVSGENSAMRGGPRLRKAACMFGWEGGPPLPDGGLWRPVKLLGLDGPRILDVLVHQKHEPGRVELEVEISCEEDEKEIDFTISLTSPDGRETVFPAGSRRLAVESPQLWWPRGYGEQPLYTVKVEALIDGAVADRWERKTGLRTMALNRERDGFGERFAHVVNGVEIFAMGAGYVPEDCLLPRRSQARTRRLLEDCAAAHFNLVRVWGGGHYPEDSFYDICDELGLLVWQDLMFAGAGYELDRAFGENVRAEMWDNVRRLRHHPCIALWCGGCGTELDGAEAAPKRRAEHIRLFEYLIPETLEKADPDRPYWPSSPSSGGGFDEPNSPDRGDAQDWSLWRGTRPFGPQGAVVGRYVSQFGFVSWPCLRTVETFTEPRDRNLSSRVMDQRVRSPQGGERLAAALQSWFLHTPDFSTSLYASQLVQAQAVRWQAEALRRERGRCMGALYGQVNDSWPGASCSSIDYLGRWKALHYFAKRFFAPLSLFCQVENALAGTSSPLDPWEPRALLCVCNETGQSRQVQVRWALRDRWSRVKREEIISLNVPARTSAKLEPAALPEAEPYTDYISFELWEKGVRASLGAELFAPPKHYEFLDPELRCWAEDGQVVVRAGAFAHCVEVQNGGEDLVLEDNYFDMLPGERRVKILRGQPHGLRVRSVYDIR